MTEEKTDLPRNYLMMDDDAVGIQPSIYSKKDYNALCFGEDQLADAIAKGTQVPGSYLPNPIVGKTIQLPSGSVSSPAKTFFSDQDTGEYLIGANNVGFSAGGALTFDYDASVLRVATGKTFRITDMTSGSVLFALANGEVSQDNTNFYWDDTNNVLNIGATREATSTAGIVKLFGSAPFITFRNSTTDVEAFYGMGVVNAAELAAGTYTNNNFKLYTNNTLRITIAAGGAVTHTTVAGAPVQFNSTNVDADIYMGSSGGSYLFCLNGGTNTIGINCPGTVPRRRLDVLDTTDPQIRATHTDNTHFFEFKADSSGYGYLIPSGNRVLLASDSYLLYFGAGSDAYFQYDGTDMKLVTDAVAASDFVLDCGTNKTLELAEVVWDDIRVAGSNLKLLGSKDPGFEAFTGGVYAYYFADEAVNEDEVFFSIQIPHDYKEGSDVTPHVHWAPEDNTAGNVRWALEYEWQNIGTAYAGTTTITVDAASPAVAKQHAVGTFSAITGTGKTISSMMLCRLYRNSSHANDTLTGKKAYLLEFDLHYQKDTMGSRQISTK
jgi:hypothetical protein